MKTILVNFSMNHPKIVIALILVITVLFGMQMPKIKIDTDPENMLPENEEVRLFHSEVKEVFGLNDILVVGIVREAGVFNPETLERVVRITDRIRDMDGVIYDDLLAPTDVDDIYTTGATIAECSKALQTAGAKRVEILTLSRALEQ